MANLRRVSNSGLRPDLLTLTGLLVWTGGRIAGTELEISLVAGHSKSELWMGFEKRV